MGKKKNKGGEEYTLEKVFELAKVSGVSLSIQPTGETGTGSNVHKNTQNYTSGNEPDLSTTDALYQSMHSNISSIKSDLSSTQTDLNDTKTNMQSKVDDLRKELEGKIDIKIDGKYFWGAVYVLGVFGLLIFTLSYNPLISTVNNFDKKFVGKEDFDSLSKRVNSNNDYIKSNYATNNQLVTLEDKVKKQGDEIKRLDSAPKGTGALGVEKKVTDNN